MQDARSAALTGRSPHLALIPGGGAPGGCGRSHNAEQSALRARAALRSALRALVDDARSVPLRLVARDHLDASGAPCLSPEFVRYLTGDRGASDIVELAVHDAAIGAALARVLTTVDVGLARFWDDYAAAAALVPRTRRRGLPKAGMTAIAARYGRGTRGAYSWRAAIEGILATCLATDQQGAAAAGA